MFVQDSDGSKYISNLLRAMLIAAGLSPIGNEKNKWEVRKRAL